MAFCTTRDRPLTGGNIQAIYDQTHAYFIWFASRPTAYGAAPGYRPLPLDHGGNVVSSSAWRGRWSDVTGLTWLGARYYDPQAGRFFSADPLGHEATPDLYSFANGDPVNFFDPDGRFAANAFLGALEGEFGTENRGTAGAVGQIGVGLTPVGVAADGRDFFATFSEFMEGDSYFTDVLFAAAMAIPGASELKNSGRLFSSLDEAADLRRIDSPSGGGPPGGGAPPSGGGGPPEGSFDGLNPGDPLPDLEIVVMGNNRSGNFILRPGVDDAPIGDIVTPGKSASIASDLTLETEIAKMFGREVKNGDILTGGFVEDIRAAGFEVIFAPTERNPLHVRIIGQQNSFDDEAAREFLSLGFDRLEKARNR